MEDCGDFAVTLTPPKPLKGRGALENPSGRFESIDVAPDPEFEGPEAIRTRFFKDHTRNIISFNDSPDVGFEASINPYRGCEHGCIYCYARPTHEYLGLSCGLDFESQIFVKTDAPQLLRKALLAKSWVPRTIAMSGVTDPYQPVERKLQITRGCLEVLAEFRNPVGLITKNALVIRDVDVLSELARHQAACVFLSITTLDEDLARTMEPRTASPSLRLEAIRILSAAGIPVGVMMAPIVPGLTDHEIDAVLKAASDAGACSAGYTMLRLPYGVKDIFKSWAETHFPDRAQRILHRIEDVRDGKLNESGFGSRMRGQGVYADYIAQMFAMAKSRHGLNRGMPELSTDAFRRDAAEQLNLF